MNNKVDLMIVGAQKAGTTSLNQYLSQHPQIFTHYALEFSMFADLDEYEKGFAYHYKKGLTPDSKKKSAHALFAAKRVDLIYDIELLKKLKEHNAGVKIVLVLRNPIERAFSAFGYCHFNGMEPYTLFEDAIYKNDPHRFENEAFKKSCDYIGRSTYAENIKKLTSLFPVENIKIYLFEEMIKDLNKHLNEMSAMLSLPSFSFDTSVKFNEQRALRSRSFSKLLAPGKFKNLKIIMPVRYRVMLKRKLKSLNSAGNIQKNNSKRIDENTRAYLRDVFKNDVVELETITNLPVRKFWPEYFS
jgi:hypothetical protein